MTEHCTILPQQQAMVSVSRLMTNHPGWIRSSTMARRAFRFNESEWSVICHQRGVAIQPKIECVEPAQPAPVDFALDWFDPVSLPLPMRNVRPFKDCGRVARVRNPDLWDALISPILKQRDADTKARKAYRRLCINYGQKVPTAIGNAFLAPSAEAMLSIPKRAFDEMNLSRKGEYLSNAAREYLQLDTTWRSMTASELLTLLRQLPHVGTWTANTAVADVTNDHSVFHFDNFIAYARAKQFFTSRYSDLAEPEFTDLCEQLTRTQLSTAIALMLSRPPLASKWDWRGTLS